MVNVGSTVEIPSREGGQPAALPLQAVSKTFGHVVALDNADLEVRRGEILAIVGDNGAGKSTMLNIMAGLFRPDHGTLVIENTPTELHSPADAKAAGVAAVFQNLALVEMLDVATNMFLGGIPTRYGFVDRRRMERDSTRIIDELNVGITSVTRQVGMLSGGQRQVVAIARALLIGAPVVLMDEPTAALGVRETIQAAELIRGLRDKGRAVICVSHDLRFVFDVADRVQVMRLGRVVGVRDVARTNHDEIVALITGSRADNEWGGA